MDSEETMELFRAAVDGSLYEARWGEVVKFLSSIQEILWPLSVLWNEDKFLRGVDADGASRPSQFEAEQRQQQKSGITAFDPKAFSSVLRSGRFHVFCKLCLKLEDVPEQVSKLADGCPCHASLFQGLSRRSRDRILRFMLENIRRDAPSRG